LVIFDLSMNELIQKLYGASESRRQCRITLDGEPFPRVIHPYGVCTTSRKKIVLVCQQVAGFTKAGRTAGFRNLDFQRVKEVEVMEETFILDGSFNPTDPQYKEWVYHI